MFDYEATKDFVASLYLESQGKQEADDTDMISTINDTEVLMWMAQTFPLWRIDHITEGAATMISSARIQTEVEMKPVLLIAKEGHLFSAVKEILTFENHEHGWMIAISIAIAPSIVFTHMLPMDDDVISDYDESGCIAIAKRFVLNYLALQSCEKSPIAVHEVGKKRNTGIHYAPSRNGSIKPYTVSLTHKYKTQVKSRAQVARDGKEGKTLTLVEVSGFVRSQPYGKGREQRRTIWVDGFTRGQWVRSGIHMVTVNE